MIEAVDKDRCCGCEACAQICPRHCLSMVEDLEGFLFPRVDGRNCIKCGRCLRVCPVLNGHESSMSTMGYAYRTTDDELLKRTSSGGFFSEVAERILDEGGVVFGAAFNAQNEVFHCWVERKSDLDGLRRSKYVQSRIGTAFMDCRRFLTEGRKVLFSGTPCQVKALYLFLGNNPRGLVTVDFVCHGVPSPGVFRKYLEEFACGRGGSVVQLREINFRAKDLGNTYPYAFSCSLGQFHYVENSQDNKFLRGFLSDIFLRRSCYNCSAKGFSSGADYTMCDFWTVRTHMPNFPIGEVPGVSQVFTHVDKLKIFEVNHSKAIVIPFDIHDRRIIQCWLTRSVPLTWRRERFFELYLQGNMSVAKIVGMVTERTSCEKIIGGARKCVGWILKRLGI